MPHPPPGRNALEEARPPAPGLPVSFLGRLHLRLGPSPEACAPLCPHLLLSPHHPSHITSRPPRRPPWEGGWSPGRDTHRPLGLGCWLDGGGVGSGDGTPGAGGTPHPPEPGQGGFSEEEAAGQGLPRRRGWVEGAPGQEEGPGRPAVTQDQARLRETPTATHPAHGQAHDKVPPWQGVLRGVGEPLSVHAPFSRPYSQCPGKPRLQCRETFTSPWIWAGTNPQNIPQRAAPV